MTDFTPIKSPCLRTYTAVHHDGTRSLDQINLIVMHDTEGKTAQGAAEWFQNPGSGGSAHLVVDDNVCYRTLNDNQIPWGAYHANVNGFHIEQAGFARWTTTIWNTTHRRTIKRAAYKAAFHCHKFGIRARFLTSADLVAGTRNGITTHAQVSKAFGGDHWDPGTGWPRLLFMQLVRYYKSTM